MNVCEHQCRDEDCPYCHPENTIESRLAAAERRARIAERALEIVGVAPGVRCCDQELHERCIFPTVACCEVACCECEAAWAYALAEAEEDDPKE